VKAATSKIIWTETCSEIYRDIQLKMEIEIYFRKNDDIQLISFNIHAKLPIWHEDEQFITMLCLILYYYVIHISHTRTREANYHLLFNTEPTCKSSIYFL
jgi:hypothetical protein